MTPRPHPIFRLSALMARWHWIDKAHGYHLKGARNESKTCAELANAVHLCITEGLV